MPTTTTLITGATGFLGREIVRTLCAADDDLALVALVRAKDERDLEARRARLVAGLPEAHARRVSAVRGDVEHPRLGQDARGWDRLVSTVDRAIHVAASVRFDHPLDEARRINVGGTEEVLALCRAIRAAGRSGRLDYVGTAFVAGDRQDLAREDELDVGQGFRNTYERSKMEAEARVRLAASELPVVIHRPSIIVGDSHTGATSSYKTIYWPMKVLVRFYGLWEGVLPQLVRLPVRPECRLDIVPVDWVADAVARLYRARDAEGLAVHLAAGPRAATIGELVAAACDHFGVAHLRFLDPLGPSRHVGRALRPILRRVAPRFAANAELMMAYTIQNPAFDTTVAQRLGLVAPDVRVYFEKLVEFAYSEDFGKREKGGKSGKSA